MSYQAFQWPEFDPDDPPHIRDLPDWLVQTAANGTLRVKDDLAHVRGPDGDCTVHPGDWIVRAPDGCLFALSDELYRTLTQANVKVALEDRMKAVLEGADTPGEPEADPDNAYVEGADVPDEPMPDDGAEFRPPFSPTVLARSARARAMQAEYDKARSSHHPRNLDDISPDTNPPSP